MYIRMGSSFTNGAGAKSSVGPGAPGCSSSGPGGGVRGPLKHAAILITGLLAIAAASLVASAEASGTPPSRIVQCHDPVRNLVQKKLRSNCPADRIVDDAEAARIRASSRFERFRTVSPRQQALPSDAGPAEMTATAFAVASKGLFLTNAHAVAGCSSILLERPAEPPVGARLVALDDHWDLALVRAVSDISKPMRFRAERPQPRDAVMTIGYPVRTLVPQEPTSSDGMVLAADDRSKLRGHLAIQTMLYPGNSGGPLLDDSGAVIGVVTAKVDTPKVYQRTGKLVRDVGFAIPAEAALAFLKRAGVTPLLAEGRPPAASGGAERDGAQSIVRLTCRV